MLQALSTVRTQKEREGVCKRESQKTCHFQKMLSGIKATVHYLKFYFPMFNNTKGNEKVKINLSAVGIAHFV